MIPSQRTRQYSLTETPRATRCLPTLSLAGSSANRGCIEPSAGDFSQPTPVNQPDSSITTYCHTGVYASSAQDGTGHAFTEGGSGKWAEEGRAMGAPETFEGTEGL